MEENQTSTPKQDNSGNNKKWIIIGVIGIIVILIAAGGGFLFLNSDKEGSLSDEMMEESEEENVQLTPASTTEPESMAPVDYKDGTYTATGTYSYHSGTESIEVTLTLKDGVITESKVIAQAKVPVSKKIQADFIANYESEVVGKNINEVELGKISGSSLTPIGFNAAVEEIKTQASQG